ncbi:MAG TPA: DUF3098 domain-containing protein [Bacteroidales bacterium]|nr:DUF3098 domain-containing protein [Bacteroidales bacterium]
MAKKTIVTTKTGKEEEKPQGGFAFERQNYLLMVIGIVLLIIGFLLMTGGGSDVPNVFNYDIFNFRRLTLSPIIIIAGFIIEIFAIMWNPKKKVKK